MYEVLKSSTFDSWLRGLRDRDAKARIEVRIRRLSLGNPGQFRALKEGVNELKIDHGPGYRVYYTFKGKTLILLLCGGDKSSQGKDIRLAMDIAASWEN
ncbi:type II toxin-antitoxin system RelE/ParE family toxin [Comamonas sp. NLF-1-9]|uniref:type II toxin-antitoxin system RelE/ParE family toxin n=1 Tax=Comamonas sp. NLF-1-9 TaxID=2853163 RepID=UPI001C48FEBA|nr:type II toxin-antitoxin system RelE/ParE family toxin [Comamonas sp. NLF-1-9]QXL85802.1 type II toxin-antitoxin system RelE/ParE family toxin [Comamonas sp. NLF-1-9]